MGPKPAATYFMRFLRCQSETGAISYDDSEADRDRLGDRGRIGWGQLSGELKENISG